MGFEISRNNTPSDENEKSFNHSKFRRIEIDLSKPYLTEETVQGEVKGNCIALDVELHPAQRTIAKQCAVETTKTAAAAAAST